MTPPAEVVEWLANRYPKPRIDADWLQGCYNWLVDEEKLSPALNLSAFMEGFEYQLLASDLSDSMQNNTGLQLDVRRPVTTLRGPPVLVQIVSITDIGMPAARLDQIRVAREEWKGSNVDTAEDKGDGYAPGIPSYPRGTLYLKLSDGTTTINAMEYRPLPQLTMGNTELGYKIQLLEGTRICNGMALLEPATVKLLGGWNESEAAQLENFERGLADRRNVENPRVAN